MRLLRTKRSQTQVNWGGYTLKEGSSWIKVRNEKEREEQSKEDKDRCRVGGKKKGGGVNVVRKRGELLG